MKTLVSLFSGIAGLDEGLHRAGFNPLFCSELDVHARGSLLHWCSLRNVSPIINCDINEICPYDLKKELGLKVGHLDLLAGGPPCQSFSLIGNRRSLDDTRGMLLFKMVEFAKALKPKAILVEQVRGLLSAKGADGQPGAVFNEFLEALTESGYRVSSSLLRAADYGVPQLRDRVFIVALKGTREFQFPNPSHFPERLGLLNKYDVYRSVRDAIYDLPPPVKKGQSEQIPGHLDVTSNRDKERISGVPEGQCLAKQMHLPKSQRMNLNPKKDTTKFRRLSWDSPALTLRGGEAFYHPVEDRYLTPREYMRLHGFSDDHILTGPIRARSGSVRDLDQHRQVANAVPPQLGEVIGKAINKIIS